MGTAPASVAVTPDGAKVYVGNSWTSSVSVLSTATNTVTATVPAASPSLPAGPFILGSAFPRRPAAYVTREDNALAVLDLGTHTVKPTVRMGSYPSGVGVTPDGARVYVANNTNATVSVFTTATNTMTNTIPVGNHPWGVAVRPDGARVYVANNASDTVSVIATATNTVTGAISVGNGPRGLAVTPNGARVYVANEYGNAVTVIATATNMVVDPSIPVGSNPRGLAVTPDGVQVYVTNYGDNTVSVIPTATNRVATTVTVGDRPYGVAVTPDGTRAYVANAGSRSVSVLDTATNTVVATIAVGDSPYGVAVTPDGARVYVANYDDETLSVIATATNTVVGTVSVGSDPIAFGTFLGPGPLGGILPSRVGVFRPSAGTFYLDANGSGTWEGCSTDQCLSIGMTGDVPFVGDWNGTGPGKVGLFRPSTGTFYLDYNGNGIWDGCGTDRCLQIGMNGDMPLVGDWNGSGPTKVGVFRPNTGTFYLDYNGSGTWEGCGTDRCLQIGMNGDAPLVGKW